MSCKQCSKCGEVKPLDQFFNRARGSSDGKMSSCKSCKTSATYKWRANNKDRWNEYVKTRSAAPEAKAAKKAARSTEAAKQKARMLEQKASRKAQKKAWREANRERLRFFYAEKNHRRRMAVKSGAVTKAQWLGICAKFKNRCVYCGAIAKLTMDHVVPLSAGGEHTADNLVPACLPCNRSKGPRDQIEFAQRFLGRLL